MPGPIFTRDPASPWETTEVRAPSVYVLPDGRVRMLYASGASIGEAESTDGVHFQRVDPDPSTPAVEPVLGPAAPAAPGSLLPNEKGPFDTGAVGDPCAVLRTTPRAGFMCVYSTREQTRRASTSIGLAGRYGDQGPLTRQPTPVYSVGAKESAPALLELPAGSYLYVQQDRRVDERLTYKAIAAAFAPGSVKLPAPAPFPEGSLACYNFSMLVGLFLGVIFVTPIVLTYLFFIRWADRFEPEPWWLILVAFVWGAIFATLGGGLTSSIASNLTSSLFDREGRRRRRRDGLRAGLRGGLQGPRRRAHRARERARAP